MAESRNSQHRFYDNAFFSRNLTDYANADTSGPVKFLPINSAECISWILFGVDGLSTD